MKENTKKYLVVGGFALFVAVIVIISVVNIVWNNIHSVTVNLLVAPADSEILLNNEKVSAGVLRLAPGEYEFLVSHDGFEPQTQNVTLEAGDKKNVYMGLVSNDPSTADWYETHPKDAEILEGISSWAYSEAMDELLTGNDILENLPVYADEYTLGYGNCKDDGGPEFCIVIKADFGFRDAAIKYLQGTGKDMARYYVKIMDYTSPFRDFSFEVPDGLEFSEIDKDSRLSQDDLSEIRMVVEDRISSLKYSSRSASVLQLKGFGNRYCAVKIKVGGESDGSLRDTYRMILVRAEGGWSVASNIVFLLNYESNPKLPQELVKLANEF